MERLLVVGVDTVAGANLALSLTERYRVSTWAPTDKYDVANCDAVDPDDAPRKIVAEVNPDWVIHCGPAARSVWDPATAESIDETIVSDVHDWATATAEYGKHFLMLSSDGVFTGPWMFHDEDGPGQCHSHQALVVRAAEQQALECTSQALVIRTNAFGWSPESDQGGWVETLLNEVAFNRIVEQDHIRHATPILATDLAEIVERACLENLSGLFHVAGAERISPLKFAQRLSDQFDLPWLSVRKESILSEVPQGFGVGECSLQTKQIRKALCVAMPLLSEGLQRLHEQATNGFRDQLARNPAKLPPIVATTNRAA